MQLLATFRSRGEAANRGDPPAAKHAEGDFAGLLGAARHHDGDIGIDGVGREPALNVLEQGRGVDARGPRLYRDGLTQRPRGLGGARPTGERGEERDGREMEHEPAEAAHRLA